MLDAPPGDFWNRCPVLRNPTLNLSFLELLFFGLGSAPIRRTLMGVNFGGEPCGKLNAARDRQLPEGFDGDCFSPMYVRHRTDGGSIARQT